MKIRTLWRWNPAEPDICPWLVAAVDEYTEEEHDGVPEFFERERCSETRELILHVPESSVRGLFAVPEVEIPTSAIKRG